ncbi:hypothetical protein HK405_004852, partial [Cladochytrium tenue]
MATPWWHRYAGQLRSAPGSHLTAFLVLHEVTAVLPLPLVYYGLQATGLQVPLPASLRGDDPAALEAIVRRARGVAAWAGIVVKGDFDDGRRELDAAAAAAASAGTAAAGTAAGWEAAVAAADQGGGPGRLGRGARVFLDVVTAYAVVKALMPVR